MAFAMLIGTLALTYEETLGGLQGFEPSDANENCSYVLVYELGESE